MVPYCKSVQCASNRVALWFKALIDGTTTCGLLPCLNKSDNPLRRTVLVPQATSVLDLVASSERKYFYCIVHVSPFPFRRKFRKWYCLCLSVPRAFLASFRSVLQQSLQQNLAQDLLSHSRPSYSFLKFYYTSWKFPYKAFRTPIRLFMSHISRACHICEASKIQ